MNKNDILRATVDGWSSNGGGVAFANPGEGDTGQRFPIFVPFAAPGDVLDLRVLKVAKTHAFGRIETLVEPSNVRICNDCDVFGKCGGCDLRHVSYEAELDFKRERVEQALRRIGGVTVEVPPPIASPTTERYRNKMTFQVRNTDRGIECGLYRRHSHDLVCADDCRIQSEGAAIVAAAYREVAERWSIGDTRWLVYRENGEGRGQLVVVTAGAVTANLRKVAAELCERCRFLDGVLHCENAADGNVPLKGRITTLCGLERLVDTLCGFEFEISPHSFYQVNCLQAEQLYQTAVEFAQLEGHERVLDLYCGIGTLTLALARTAGSVVGAEIVAAAVDDARSNAARNCVQNVEFVCGDAGTFDAGGSAFDVVVVDPPRKGLSGEALDGIATIAPHRIVYVSCDPATQARDVKALAEHGYTVQRVQPVDMFPRTAHVECVVLMTREKNGA